MFRKGVVCCAQLLPRISKKLGINVLKKASLNSKDFFLKSGDQLVSSRLRFYETNPSPK